MNRLVMMAVAAGAAMAAMAMPTRQQLAKAQEMVSDVTAADVAALKAGAKKPAEVAAKHMELAAQAGSEAEKYLLLQGAFHLYVKGEDYDNAAKAIETMQAEIKDFNPEVIVELCGKALVRKMQENAPRLYAIKENARRIVFYRKQLPIRGAAVRKNPKDLQAQRRLAECHAELGDWPKALEVFAKAGGEFKKMAEGETSGKVPAQELGDFWWDYETKSDTQVYKLHAAELYRKAHADDSFKGLARTRAEQRVKEVTGDTAIVAAAGQGVSPRTPAATGLYCVIDLSGGPDAKKYPVSYLNDVPKGGWSDEYKTTKLVLRRIEPGSFMMGEKGKGRHVAIKEPFYMGVFEVTQKQWSLIIGDRPSFWKGPQWSVRPVEQVSFERIRGKNLGSKWPESDEVDEYSFMWLLRQKTNLRFDLPTEAQWEYACRAGTETDYYTGEQCKEYWHDSSADKIGRYMRNGGWDEEKWGKFEWGKAWSAPDRDCTSEHGTASVGTYIPNNWGLYDMSGNVAEMCLDRFVHEPKPNEMFRASRGGRWFAAAAELKSNSRERYGCGGDDRWFGHGLRLCLPLAGGAAASAPAIKSAPVAMVGKAWQEKGNEATLTLKDGVKIDFVKCPAGDFKMLCVYGWEPQSFRARISRPFWIAKMGLTKQQLSSIFPEIERLKPKAGEERNRVGVDECLALELFDRLREDFANSLPASCRNYVFRMPSMAEYEYAYHANTHDRNDPYIHIDQKNLSKKDNDDMGSLNKKCGENRPNAWGIHDLFGCMTFLDRLDSSNSVVNEKPGEGWFKNFYGVKSVIKPKDGTDPFFWTESESYLAASSWWGQFSFGRNGIKGGVVGTLSLVIGPDLVSEWKAKNGKK